MKLAQVCLTALLCIVIGVRLDAQEAESAYKQYQLLTMVEVTRLISEDRVAHSPVIRSLSEHLSLD